MLLRNPHSVLAALRLRPGSVADVRLASERPHGAWADVVAEAEQQGVRVRTSAHERTSSSQRGSGRRSAKFRKENEQKERRASSAEATVSERTPFSVEQLLANPAQGQSEHPVWLALDCLQDPHNLGAVFRSAAFFGVAGVFLTKDKSAPLSATAYDVASGGCERVPFAIVTNLVSAFEKAQQAGIWILGSSEHASQAVTDVTRDRPWMLVVGNEEKGIRSLTEKKCDETCRIAARHSGDLDLPGLDSLNASVATAVLLAELTR